MDKRMLYTFTPAIRKFAVLKTPEHKIKPKVLPKGFGPAKVPLKKVPRR